MRRVKGVRIVVAAALTAAALGLSGCDEIMGMINGQQTAADTGACETADGARKYYRTFITQFAQAHKDGVVTFEQYGEMMTKIGLAAQKAEKSGDIAGWCAEIDAAYAQYKIPHA